MAAIKQLKSYVGGQWVAGTGTPRPLYNPTTEEVIAETSGYEDEVASLYEGMDLTATENI